ncbi:PREDICTED: protein boule-like [Cyprinodon variegatus]|uniref:protein boule-like n=1 Tax=Cyprinodon variegatus TaxID=28743 RepID=UPI0007427714|nr:PREDICTED: protein boule-like [Cyprinodon variegatus]
MEVENQNSLASSDSLHDDSSSSSEALIQESPLERFTYLSPIPCTIIPNRIFVGRMDHRVNESNLHQIFFKYGAVKDVKIVKDGLGISKRYGFVTFETQEDVLRILNNANGICFNGRKLCISQAYRKFRVSGQANSGYTAHHERADPHQMSCGTFYLTPFTGQPYTYYKGVAYFHCPSMNPSANDWSPTSQLMLPPSHQPFHPLQPPVYLHCQDAPNQYQWNIGQVPAPFGAPMYQQQPEYLYQPFDGSCYLPPGPAMEGSTPEFFELTAPHFYSGMTPIPLQPNPRENQPFSPSCVHRKPKYRRHMHPKYYYHLPQPTETPATSVFPVPAPHVG